MGVFVTGKCYFLSGKNTAEVLERCMGARIVQARATGVRVERTVKQDE